MTLRHLVNVTGSMSMTLTGINCLLEAAVLSDDEFNFGILLVISYIQFSTQAVITLTLMEQQEKMFPKII